MTYRFKVRDGLNDFNDFNIKNSFMQIYIERFDLYWSVSDEY